MCAVSCLVVWIFEDTAFAVPKFIEELMTTESSWIGRWSQAQTQRWDWGIVKKEEDIAGVWGPQKAPSEVQGQRTPEAEAFLKKNTTENAILEVVNNKLVT